MSTLTRGVTVLRPEPTEVALAHLSTDSVVRFEFGGRVRDHGPLWQGAPLVLTFAGDGLEWGCRVCQYGVLRLVRNGRHALDRPKWDAAVKAVKDFGVIYLGFALRDYFRKPRWTAVGLRFDEPQAEPGQSPRVLWRDPSNPAEAEMTAYDEAGYWGEQLT